MPGGSALPRRHWALPRRLIDASVAYAREREAFGQKIGEFQGIGFKLADMKTRIEASRLLVYNAALAKEAAKTEWRALHLEASMAKLFASETAVRCRRRGADPRRDGLQQGAARRALFRDARITEIYEGTSEIQRLVIARAVTGLK